MNDEEIVARLRVNRNLSAVRLAELLRGLTDRSLTQGTIATYFKRAFPSIPLRVLLDAGAWRRVSGGELTDEGFNELLRPWLADAVAGESEED